MHSASQRHGPRAARAPLIGDGGCGHTSGMKLGDREKSKSHSSHFRSLWQHIIENYGCILES